MPASETAVTFAVVAGSRADVAAAKGVHMHMQNRLGSSAPGGLAGRRGARLGGSSQRRQLDRELAGPVVSEAIVPLLVRRDECSHAIARALPDQLAAVVCLRSAQPPVNTARHLSSALCRFFRLMTAEGCAGPKAGLCAVQNARALRVRTGRPDKATGR
jgi:hypothetical protein